MAQNQPQPSKSDVIESDEDAIVDKTWDEARSDHTSAGSTGETVDALQGKLPDGSLPDQADVASPSEVNTQVASVLGADIPDGPTAGSRDLALQRVIDEVTAARMAHLDADISSRSTLAQSDILSDATPFAGANLDAAVSTRSSHDPSAIIDDGTALDRSNLDSAAQRVLNRLPSSAGIVTVQADLASLWERDGSTHTQVTLADASTEETILDVGADAGTNGFKLESLLVNVATGDHTNITVTVRAEVNGTLQDLYSDSLSDGVSNILDGRGPIAARHVQVVAVGDAATGGTNDGTVDATAEVSQAT